jgi:hypothetical protein
MRKLAVLMFFGVLVGASREAAAQGSPDDRIYLNIGFGVESGSTDSNDTKEYSLYDEPATTSVNTSWTSGSFFGGGIAFRVYRNLMVGLAYHQETNTSEAAITGTAPNPIFFNRPRTFTESEEGLYRRENAAHVSLGWIVPIGTKADVIVSAGPSFFRLQQDVVSEARVIETGLPFTSVAIDTDRSTQKRSVVGFNASADVTYIVWQNDHVRLGGGGFLRYTAADSEVRLFVNDVDTKIGGFQFGFGIRARF